MPFPPALCGFEFIDFAGADVLRSLAGSCCHGHEVNPATATLYVLLFFARGRLRSGVADGNGKRVPDQNFDIVSGQCPEESH